VPFGDAIVEVVKTLGAGAVFFASTSFGKDVAPRVAALLDGGQASDIIAVLPDGGFRRPMYAGDVLADVEVTTPFKVVTVRTSAFAPAVAGGAGAAIREVQLSGAIRDVGQVTGYEGARSERPELAGAAVVVSGGRALGSAENFQKVMFPLADALHAAVGASRAAVDSGYAPNDWQVGQTGKIVAPGLYIAVGISGAIQHLAGMKDSKVIVAINKDPEAPIFDVATYGLVGDLFTVVPAFLDELRK
jgi:electron transfer flavoprotein alpha subunit